MSEENFNKKENSTTESEYRLLELLLVLVIVTVPLLGGLFLMYKILQFIWNVATTIASNDGTFYGFLCDLIYDIQEYWPVILIIVIVGFVSICLSPPN